jgi:hypothetical protein
VAWLAAIPNAGTLVLLLRVAWLLMALLVMCSFGMIVLWYIGACTPLMDSLIENLLLAIGWVEAVVDCFLARCAVFELECVQQEPKSAPG